MAANSGRCLCEAVKYELYGKPLTCAVCHCDSCQKFSGSVMMANCWYRQENFKLVRGHDCIQTYNEQGTTTGQTMQRSFCRLCGSCLFQQTGHLQQAGVVSVTSGTMDDRSETQPTLEAWCRNRRAWLSLEHEGEKLDTQ